MGILTCNDNDYGTGSYGEGNNSHNNNAIAGEKGSNTSRIHDQNVRRGVEYYPYFSPSSCCCCVT